jgi:hypothetical protein
MIANKEHITGAEYKYWTEFLIANAKVEIDKRSNLFCSTVSEEGKSCIKLAPAVSY